VSSGKEQARGSSRRGRHGAAAAPGSTAPADGDQGGGETGDGPGRWQPIVVENKIEEFESAPPGTRPYIPDTVCDGWSTDRVAVRMASVRGYMHRYAAVPRQDDADLAFDPATGAVVFAVADGVSSATHAHIGAAAACRAAVDAILGALSAPEAAGPDWPAVLDAAAVAVTGQAAGILGRPPADGEETERLVATTLVAGYLRPSATGLRGSVAAIGDSSAWLYRAGRYEPVLPVKESGYLVSAAVSPLPRLPETIAQAVLALDADAVLLVGTDGFGDPLGDGDGKVGALFAKHLAAPPPPLEFAHLLDFSRETFDDDRTLIAIWPRPGERGRP
jgi:hypothetical protein